MGIETAAILLVTQYAFLGAGIKYIDQVYDEKIWSKKVALILAVACGLLMGYLVATDVHSAVIFIGMVLAVSLAKKIDNLAFSTGVLLVLGTPVAYLTFVSQVTLNWAALFALTVSGLMDEWGNDLYDKGKITGAFGKFFDNRFSMKVAMFALPALNVMPWTYFVAFLAFDIAYSMVGWASQSYIARRDHVVPARPVNFGRRWYDKFVVWRWHEIES